MGVSLDYKGTDFFISKKCYHKTKSKNDISINKFGYENKHLTFLFLKSVITRLNQKMTSV